ncbi:MAG: UPF0175 family protein [Candidatus Poribacteria bacterium]|nr:UPF0175 family protein [Candidatus Poribacteria bacterium]
MGNHVVDIGNDLIELLPDPSRPIEDSVRELILLALYGQGEVSSGRAAQLLNMDRVEFIKHASRRGIPYIEMDADEWAHEMETISRL